MSATTRVALCGPENVSGDQGGGANAHAASWSSSSSGEAGRSNLPVPGRCDEDSAVPCVSWCRVTIAAPDIATRSMAANPAPIPPALHAATAARASERRATSCFRFRTIWSKHAVEQEQMNARTQFKQHHNCRHPQPHTLHTLGETHTHLTHATPMGIHNIQQLVSCGALGATCFRCLLGLIPECLRLCPHVCPSLHRHGGRMRTTQRLHLPTKTLGLTNQRNKHRRGS